MPLLPCRYLRSFAGLPLLAGHIRNARRIACKEKQISFAITTVSTSPPAYSILWSSPGSVAQRSQHPMLYSKPLKFNAELH